LKPADLRRKAVELVFSRDIVHRTVTVAVCKGGHCDLVHGWKWYS
jgi:hypothetical protein